MALINCEENRIGTRKAAKKKAVLHLPQSAAYVMLTYPVDNEV